MVHVVSTDSQTFTVSELGHSGIECLECEYSYTLAESDDMMNALGKLGEHGCPKCGNAVYSVDGGVKVNVRGDHEAMLVNDSEVTKARWFHATPRDDWYDVVCGEGDPDFAYDIENAKPTDDTTILVHIGTREAALDRARSEYNHHDWYMYEIVVNADAEIATLVLDDDIDVPTRAYNCNGTDWNPNGVTRYINAYESIGSISLLANPNAFSVISIEPIPASIIDSSKPVFSAELIAA